MINKFDLVSFSYPYGEMGSGPRTHIVTNKLSTHNTFLKLQGWKAKYGVVDTMFYVDPIEYPNGNYPFQIPTGIDCSVYRSVVDVQFDNVLVKGSIMSHSKLIDEITTKCISIGTFNLDREILCSLNYKIIAT